MESADERDEELCWEECTHLYIQKDVFVYRGCYARSCRVVEILFREIEPECCLMAGRNHHKGQSHKAIVARDIPRPHTRPCVSRYSM